MISTIPKISNSRYTLKTFQLLHSSPAFEEIMADDKKQQAKRVAAENGVFVAHTFHIPVGSLIA